MALTTCPECNKNVSDKATVCPHCGFPLVVVLQTTTLAPPIVTTPVKPGMPLADGCGKGCGTVIVVCLVIAVLVTIIGGNSPAPTLSVSYTDGDKMGFLAGNLAMRHGDARETDDEKKRAAWSIASHFTSESKEAKDDWVLGYRVGWDRGYDSH